MDIQSNINVFTEADENRATLMEKKLWDKDILFSTGLVEYSVSIWNFRTCGSNSANQF